MTSGRQLTPVASHPPMITGVQDAHPTRWDNLFLGNPLTNILTPEF
ncbi:hypothetical protein H6H03_04175 [Nostoc paludosum FACHB-159]|uniref:Uncharacterized protein n=1 Tax=Nostoc paludosum FACHB-159 TaxID=2692908 RepID=A0ABR8K2Y2_9NOSO|nr:hypothetical protein [Nostoc paludosum]MBD2733111.1 hypothetical protein [Nostoc paludosum FACHB-159]